MNSLTELIKKYSFTSGYEELIAMSIGLLFIILLAVLSNLIARKFIVHFIYRAIEKSKNKYDDVFIKRNVFARLSKLAPALVVYLLTPLVFANHDTIVQLVSTACMVYMVVILLMVADSFINAVVEIYQPTAIRNNFPLKSISQVIKLVVYFLAIISIISLIFNESPLKLIAGLGAMTAVLMLVFKDPILGFVAGLQLSSNKMVAVNDWVEIPKYGIDGDIIEIGLTTVKIRNFDKTISTVPTQALINDAVKNWRGMQESEGRRIKRSILLDINSIRFCSDADLERYSKVEYIKEYIAKKHQEVAEHNKEQKVDLSSEVNGRRLTNVGTFRAYIEAYLRNHPDISKTLTLIVRQLKPTELGLPIEIYVFSTNKNWAEYESIQADIFDHIFAVAKDFDIRIFQNPTGSDFKPLAK